MHMAEAIEHDPHSQLRIHAAHFHRQAPAEAEADACSWSRLPLPLRRARDRLREIFGKIVRNRRESGHREEDVLQQFVDAKWVHLHSRLPATTDAVVVAGSQPGCGDWGFEPDNRCGV